MKITDLNKKLYAGFLCVAFASIFTLNTQTANAAYKDMPVTGTNVVDLIITATDKYSGVKYAYVRNEGSWDLNNSRKQIGTDQNVNLIKNGDNYTYKGWKITDKQGPHVVCVALQDAADEHHGTGNRSNTTAGFCNEIYLDKEAPKEVKIVLNDGNPWTNKDKVKAEITVSDNWAGLESIKYSDNGGPMTTVSTVGKQCSRNMETGVETCKLTTEIVLNSNTSKGFSEIKFELKDKVGHAGKTPSHYMYFDKGGLDGEVSIYSDKYSSNASQIMGNKVYFGYKASDSKENVNNRQVSGIHKIIVKQQGQTDEEGKLIYQIDIKKSPNDPQAPGYVPINPSQVLTAGLTDPSQRQEFEFTSKIEEDNNKRYVMTLVVIDRAGNRKEINSQDIIINWLKLTSFQITNVVNPEIYSLADANYNNFRPIAWSKPTSHWNDLEEMGFLGSNLFSKDGEVQQFLLGTNFDYTLRWQWSGNKNAKISTTYKIWLINNGTGSCKTTNTAQPDACAAVIQQGGINTIDNPNYYIKDGTGHVVGYSLKVQLPTYEKFKRDFSKIPYDSNTRVYVESVVTIQSTEQLESDPSQTYTKTFSGRFPVLTDTNRADSKAYVGYLAGDIEDYLWFNEEY